MNIGDHVYSKSVQANGIVKAISTEYDGAPIHVEFFWAHYCNVENGRFDRNGYGKKDRKWQWCYEDDLVFVDFPIVIKNEIALVHRRITDKRLHQVALIPYASEGPADILIRYGGNLNSYPSELCINEFIVLDKRKQMEMLGEDLVSESHDYLPMGAFEDEWIIKPQRSCGGKNIKPYVKNEQRYGDYVQKRFPKVREFRAHCFLWNDSPVPFIQEKVIADQNQLCWNKKQGGAFRYVYQEGLAYGPYLGTLDDDIIERMTVMSVEALKKLKYDSGGIDFGLASDGTLKIFEVNSAMGLRERSLFTYKQIYWKLANLDIQKYKEERWM